MWAETGESPISSVVMLFCGIPGSGKSTIARIVAQNLGRTIHVQTDAFREMIHPPLYTPQESEMVYRMMYRTAREGLAHKYNVILDGTFLRETQRAEAFEGLKGAYKARIVVFVDCDLETALSRNAQRHALVPEDTVREFYARLEPPASSIRVNSAKLTAEQSAQLIIMEARRILASQLKNESSPS